MVKASGSTATGATALDLQPTATSASRESASPRLHSYIVEHDQGFAPNPFSGSCTLAACKPSIRQAAEIGDYVLGTGSAKRKLRGYAIYLMRIGRIVTFDEYWSAEEFKEKRPTMNGSNLKRYGDNIYHRHPITGEWLQEDSFHSQINGVIDPENLRIDTSHTDKVLIADWFIYWGDCAPIIPVHLSFAVHPGIGQRVIDVPSRVAAVIDWAKSNDNHGAMGDPVEWKFEAEKLRRASRSRKTA